MVIAAVYFWNSRFALAREKRTWRRRAHRYYNWGRVRYRSWELPWDFAEGVQLTQTFLLVEFSRGRVWMSWGFGWCVRLVLFVKEFGNELWTFCNDIEVNCYNEVVFDVIMLGNFKFNFIFETNEFFLFFKKFHCYLHSRAKNFTIVILYELQTILRIPIQPVFTQLPCFKWSIFLFYIFVRCKI